jgi:hypothetical protein
MLRESRDSADNPASNALIVALDVTGSMGIIPDYMVREGLKTLFTEVYSRRPVSDPHIMLMGVGDVAARDTAPLQVSQFEADIRIADQLTNLYLEGGGGRNSSESYTLPWYFAGLHTAIDCFEKRGRKGYLFTLGDEEPPEVLLRQEIERVIGPAQADLTTQQLLELASRQYHVFHIMVQQGSHYQLHGPQVKAKWRALLGQRALPLSDYTRLAEVIVSTIEVVEGADAERVAASWSGETALVVRNAVGGLVPAKPRGSIPNTGVQRF